MAACSELAIWARRGCTAELPLELSLHISVCASCTKNFARITEVRQLVGKAPVHRVSGRTLESIEVSLRTETQLARLVVPPPHKSRRWVVGAAVAVLVGSAGVAAALVRQKTATTPTAIPMRTTIPSVFVVSSPSEQGQSAIEQPLANRDMRGNGGRVNGASVTPQTKEQQDRSALASARIVPDDTAFATAFAQLNAGRAGVAASGFDALLSHEQLDGSRRSDILYWSSQAHARAGNRTLAETRARAYLNRFPNGLRAGDVALLLGDYAREKGQVSVARRYYERAMVSVHPNTVARAKQSLTAL